MKKLNLLLAAVLFCGLFTLPGCGTLDPKGPYKGDKILYDADIAISTAYDAVHVFVSWEHRNREVLKGLPQINEYADALRVQYPTWHKAAIAARQAYIGSPNDPNRTALTQAIDVLREAMRQTQNWLASTATPMLPENP